MSDRDALAGLLAQIEPCPAAPVSDVRRMRVWENEGGLLEDPLRTAPAPGSGEFEGPAWMRAVVSSRLVPDRPVHVVCGGVPVLLALTGGRVHAMLDECSHGRVLLSEGEVADGVVECRLHGSCFDMTTGMPLGPPAVTPVPVLDVRVAHGIVEVAIPASLAAAHGAGGP